MVGAAEIGCGVVCFIDRAVACGDKRLPPTISIVQAVHMARLTHIIEPLSIITGAMASVSALAAPTGVEGLLATFGIGGTIAVTATAIAPVLAKTAAVISILSSLVWAVEKAIDRRMGRRA